MRANGRERLGLWVCAAGVGDEDVRIVVELRDGDPVSELSQTAVAATSGAAVAMVAGAVSIARRW